MATVKVLIHGCRNRADVRIVGGEHRPAIRGIAGSGTGETVLLIDKPGLVLRAAHIVHCLLTSRGRARGGIGALGRRAGFRGAGTGPGAGRGRGRNIAGGLAGAGTAGGRAGPRATGGDEGSGSRR